MGQTGEQYEIAAEGYRAVVTECGAGLRHLSRDARDLVQGFGSDEMPSGGRGQLLLPWPNRIRDGRYTFGGGEHQLPVNEVGRGNASHGLVRWTAWTSLRHTDDTVRLGYRLMAQAGYPWTLDLEAEYHVSAAGLAVTVTARNRSDQPAPYATGAHPYLLAGDAPVDDWRLTLPAATRLTVDDRKIPTGREAVADTRYDFREARRLTGVELDTAYTDLTTDDSGRAEVELHVPDGTGVALWMDAAHRWIQVYTGDDLPRGARTALAVEPMSAPPNAFVSGEDLAVLPPGGTHTVRWGIAQLGAM